MATILVGPKFHGIELQDACQSGFPAEFHVVARRHVNLLTSCRPGPRRMIERPAHIFEKQR
jgi:hypothetical protein